MTAVDEARARAADAILADIRGRKLLKWLFREDADTENHPIGYVEGPIDLETQRECVDTWARLALAASQVTGTVDREARDLCDRLLPYTSHSLGCAVYWKSYPANCSCGVESIRAEVLALIRGEG